MKPQALHLRHQDRLIELCHELALLHAVAGFHIDGYDSSGFTFRTDGYVIAGEYRAAESDAGGYGSTRGVMTLTSGVDCSIRRRHFRSRRREVLLRPSQGDGDDHNARPVTHHFGGMSLILCRRARETAVLVRTSLRGHVITVHGSDLAEFEILFGLRVQAGFSAVVVWRHVTWHAGREV